MAPRRESQSPPPVARQEMNNTLRSQPDVVGVAKVKPKKNIPFKTAETRPVKQNKILGYTGHMYKEGMVSHLCPPRSEDVMDDAVSERVQNGGTMRNNTGKKGMDALLTETRSDFRPVADISLPREKVTLTGKGIAGYQGHSKRVAQTPPPRPQSQGSPAGSSRGDQGDGQNTTGSRSHKRIGSAPPSGPASAGYYVPTIKARKGTKKSGETRFQIPGYTGHLKGGQSKFGNSYGDTTRHLLTKEENQTPGVVPPIAQGQIGTATSHLNGQYFKLPNKVKSKDHVSLRKTTKPGFMATIGPAPERLVVGTSKDPEPVVPWMARKEARRPVPPDPDRKCEVPAPKAIASKIKAGDPAIPVESKDPEGDNRRRQAVCGVRLKRSDEHKVSYLSSVRLPSKAERKAEQERQAETMKSRAASKGEPPKKSANVKKAEAARHARLPELRDDIDPAATGHLPGYNGHVPKEITNVGRTLAERSRRNFKNPYGPGFGTANQDKLRRTMSNTAMTGTAQMLQHMNATYKNKPKSTFLGDSELKHRRETITAGSEAARAVREGRTHYALDPTIHTPANENVIVNGRGGYPHLNRPENVKTETRFHIPNYKGHVPRNKFKYGNTWGDTTQHVMSKDKRPLTGDVPIDAKPGRSREAYGYMKSKNRIEPKKSMNSAAAAAALFNTNSINNLGSTAPGTEKKTNFRRVRQDLNA